MKIRIAKLLLLVVVLFIALVGDAQTTTKKTTAKSKTSKSKSIPAKSPSVAVTVKLTSKCERNLMVFAGPKEKLRDPRLKEIGGLSVNTFYVKTGEVICITDAKGKPISCANITKSSLRLEINGSGTAISVP